MIEPNELQAKNRKLITRLSVLIVGMFVFAIGIMPPLYDVICDITGLNGKTSNVAASTDNLSVDAERTVRVQFIADTAPGMAWEFRPLTRSIKVHPGEIHQIDFFARNPTQHWIVGQAIPSVAPSQATNYFKKTECFCFNHQELDGLAEVNMPLIFYIDPSIPRTVRTITLSYQLYDITDRIDADSKPAEPSLASRGN